VKKYNLEHRDIPPLKSSSGDYLPKSEAFHKSNQEIVNRWDKLEEERRIKEQERQKGLKETAPQSSQR
jgi:hypothetical protein